MRILTQHNPFEDLLGIKPQRYIKLSDREMRVLAGAAKILEQMREVLDSAAGPDNDQTVDIALAEYEIDNISRGEIVYYLEGGE